MKDLLDIQFISDDMIDNCNKTDDYPIAYSYVPYQRFENLYSREKALRVGTVFPSLNKPFGVYGKEFGERTGGEKSC